MPNNKIGVIGIGKLGLSLCLNLETSGFSVIGCDIKKKYVDKINKKKFRTIEPFVNKLLKNSKSFRATTSLRFTIENSDIIFLTVRTETKKNGSYDVSQCDNVVNSLISLGYQKKSKTFIINCNVNPGYTATVKKKLLPYNYKVSFNPEWVAQGSIIKDQKYPDVVVIGEFNINEGKKIKNLYKRMCNNEPLFFNMDSLSAEITKISLNCFLTTKITFANMIGDIANKVGADYKKILNAIGNDKRIGKKYFSYGFGYGGPCFPRDNRAIIHFMNSIKLNPTIPKATQNFNKLHLKYQLEDFCKNNPDLSKPITISEVTYKSGVDILEESQKLEFAKRLDEKGYKVTIKDMTSVCDQIKKKYKNKFKFKKL